jgi:multiple sugar transport system permease protein
MASVGRDYVDTGAPPATRGMPEVRQRAQSIRLSRISRALIVEVATLASVLWLLLPFLWLVRSSLSPAVELTARPPLWLPRELSFANYLAIIQAAFVRTTGFTIPELVVAGLKNSLVVSFAVMAINLALGGLAGYAFSRFRFPLRNTMLLGLLASRMIPAFAIIIPLFVLFQQFQLYNTRHGLVIAELSATLPFTVWILKNYLDKITTELEEAALVDGASRLQAIIHVTVPVAAPGLVAAGLFAFMLTWNSFLFPLILSSSPDVMTVQPQIAAAYGEHRAEYGLLFAGSVLAALPPVVIALALQRYLMQGLLSGAVKG